MKKIGLVFLLLGLCTLNLMAGCTKNDEEDAIKAPKGYKLVWHDEFDSGSKPSSDWYYETGNHGWGNHEIQNYVACSKDNEQLSVVKDGILSIIAKRVGNEVCSIRMNSVRAWKYGYFEARLQLPTGKGTWPAFWMMPKDGKAWPDDGELDIMEEVGYDPDVIISTIHCKSYNHVLKTQKSDKTKIEGSQTGFHVYAMEWTEDEIKSYVDGKLYFTFKNDGKGDKATWPFNVPFYIKLNLAWGGDWGGAMGIDESALPAVYKIDYVRVYQKK